MGINKDSQRAPNLRFKGFTDDWEHRKLGELVSITTGKLDANAMVEGGAYDFYTSGIKKYSIDKAAFEGPAITIAGNGATVGYMHLADGKFNAYQRTYVLTKLSSDRLFTFYEISNKLPKKIQQEARTGNIPYIVMDMLTELKLSIPNSREQNYIGSFIKSLDNTITLHQRKLDQLKQLKEALLQQMFPGKGETVPKLRFAGFEGDWEERKFDEFLEEFIRKSKIENEFTTLSSTNSGMEVREGRVSGDTNIGYKIIENDDLVLSPQNLWLGNINLNYIGTGLVSPSYKTFKIKNLSSSFLKPQLRSKRLLNQYELASTQGASVVRRNLDMELFYQITLPVPVIQEQYKIGKLFKDLDDYIVLQSQKVNKLKSMKEVLLQNMFI